MKFESISVEWNGQVYLHFTRGVYKVSGSSFFERHHSYDSSALTLTSQLPLHYNQGSPSSLGLMGLTWLMTLVIYDVSTGRKITPF